MPKKTDSPELPSRPEWVPLIMRCGPCDRDWDDWQPSNCSPFVWIAHLKTLRCPYCSAKRKLMIRLGPTTEAQEHQQSQTMAAWNHDLAGGLPS